MGKSSHRRSRCIELLKTPPPALQKSPPTQVCGLRPLAETNDRHDGTAQVDVSQLTQIEPDPPLIMGMLSANQTGNSVVFRFSSADERLQRMLNDKSSQFSKEEANLFVIDLSLMPYGFKNWPHLVRRRLQVERNRRFSGVLLLHRYLDNEARSFILNSHLEEHPNPDKKLPASFLNDLMRLNKAIS